MIISIKKAEKISKLFKNRGKKIGLCHGCFDIFHFGHANYLKKAKTFCDVLFVSVSPDRFVKKGKNRPIFGCKHRINVVSSIRHADYVFSNTQRTALDSIAKIKPNFYFKGNDYNKKTSKNYKLFCKEKTAICKIKGKTILLKEPAYSSTKILRKIGTDK